MSSARIFLWKTGKKGKDFMSDFILETRHLSKTFRRQQVVKNVSLAIPENCVYGLLGANGAGKSTFLKMVTGLLRPTEGEIFFDGHPWSREDLAGIGALVETPPVYENLTAWENLKVRALLLGLPDSRIAEALNTVGLTGTGKKRAGAFSLGMKQRLGIALALLSKPKFLILDEPVNGLDPMGILELRNLIRSFPEQGMTVLVSSHILSEIEQTADYIGMMVEGELAYQGKLDGQENLESLFLEVAQRKRGSVK